MKAGADKELWEVMCTPVDKWSEHMKEFLHHLFMSHGVNSKLPAGEPIGLVGALAQFQGNMPIEKVAWTQRGGVADPEGCICAESWKSLFDFYPLNEPAHCNHFLHETTALQHLLFRWDQAAKITGRYCKYTKNQVMKWQRKNPLSADGRTKYWDWMSILMYRGDVLVPDSGGHNQLKPGPYNIADGVRRRNIDTKMFLTRKCQLRAMCPPTYSGEGELIFDEESEEEPDAAAEASPSADAEPAKVEPMAREQPERVENECHTPPCTKPGIIYHKA
jgi:hypothetical protein